MSSKAEELLAMQAMRVQLSLQAWSPLSQSGMEGKELRSIIAYNCHRFATKFPLQKGAREGAVLCERTCFCLLSTF